MKHYVYTAGPITGLTYDGAQDWRDYVAGKLDSEKIETLSPLRGKEFLRAAGVLHAGTYKETISSAKGIMGRDHFDCTRADCIFVNLLGATRISVGTVMELAWAFDRQIPVILIMEKDNIHNHVMLNETATYIVETVEEGIHLARFLFNVRDGKK